MLFLIGIFITCFLVFTLSGKKGKSLADHILLTWLLLLGVHIAIFYLRFSEQAYQFPFFLGVDFPFPLLHGPMLLLYVQAITSRFPAKRSLNLLHYAPALVAYVAMIPFYLRPAQERILVFQHQGQGYETFGIALNLAIFASEGIYFCWSLLLLRRHRSRIESYFSATEKVNLNWLRYLTYGLGAVFLVSVLLDEVWINGSIVVFVLFVGFFGINQVGIFTSPQELPPQPAAPVQEHIEVAVETQPAKRYAKSGLSAEQSEILYERLQLMMTGEELYRESEITLTQLAERLGIHSNYLSQVINEKTGDNFYAYINTLRIEAFLDLLEDPPNRQYKLISLAYDCGFNSKSSFNRYFKKVVGQTPTEYVGSRFG